MAVKKKIIRKKKRNETSEALAKITGGKELEVASMIIKQLAERNRRKKILKKDKN